MRVSVWGVGKEKPGYVGIWPYLGLHRHSERGEVQRGLNNLDGARGSGLGGISN